MARLPVRIFGLFLLTVSLSVASCQAFVNSLMRPDESQMQSIEHSIEDSIEQRDARGDR